MLPDLYTVIGGVAALVLAAVTFEGEYLVGVLVETVFENLGIIEKNWLSVHGTLFLHTIQIIFIITYLIEIKVVIFKTTRRWML